MSEIELVTDKNGETAFAIQDDGKRIAEMVVSMEPGKLTVFHTEVKQQYEGQGLAKRLLNHMVTYARGHDMKVVALCSYVHAQFLRHTEAYKDVWKQTS
jgi:uncharacterized protein